MKKYTAHLRVSPDEDLNPPGNPVAVWHIFVDHHGDTDMFITKDAPGEFRLGMGNDCPRTPYREYEHKSLHEARDHAELILNGEDDGKEVHNQEV